jgi:hypothetical protein
MSNSFIILLILSFLNCYALISRDELIEKLLYLTKQSSEYTSVSGDNLLLYKDEKFHCDCSGMIKALLNGFDIYNAKEGDKLSGFDVTGDKNSKQLIDGCTDVSNFFYFLDSAPRFLYLEGHIDHIGVYIGKNVKCGDNNEEVCNVVECTSSWGGGIKLSYVDDFGKRYDKKGGTQENKWLKNGLPSSWVQYDCKDIIPSTASDCQFSPKDKQSFKYCCFYKGSYSEECKSFTEAEYQFQLSANNALKKMGMSIEFICKTNGIEEILKDPETTDCAAITPTKSSDCVLSSEDQKYFKYCCYEKILGYAECSAYTQQGYEDEKSYVDLFELDSHSGVAFDCHTEAKDGATNSSRESNLSFGKVILYIVLILL